MKKEKQKDREDRQICIVFATALLACALLTGCGAAKEDNLSQGIALVEQMDYEGALTCFEAAALNKEDLRQVYRGQGLAYMGMTDYENAAASFEKALGQSSPRPDAMDYDINYYLATAYYRQGDQCLSGNHGSEARGKDRLVLKRNHGAGAGQYGRCESRF